MSNSGNKSGILEHTGLQFLRFLFVGGLNTLFGLLVFYLMIRLGGATWLSLVGSNLAGILFNFFSTGGLVFRDMNPRKIPRFILAYAVIYGLNLTGLDFLAPVVPSVILAQAILALPMALLSFLMFRIFVFRPIEPTIR